MSSALTVPRSRAGAWLPRLAWAALAYNVLVILWGAVVRLTGAGAGCGDHWPLCNGVVVPQSPTLHTIIEFSHRLTSGASGLLALGLFAAAFVTFLRQAPVTQPKLLSRTWLWVGLGVLGALLLLIGMAGASAIFAAGGALLGLVALLGLLTVFVNARGLTWVKVFQGWPVVLGTVLTFLLILAEGLVGGVQVLLGLTADSTDPARGLVQGVHLANTFLLLGALLLTALWASGRPALRVRGQGRALGLIAFGLVLTLLLGMAGAVTALGDLLFAPAPGTPIDTVRRDFSATAGLIQNLRVIHPMLAILGSVYLVWMAGALRRMRPSAGVTRWGVLLTGVIGLQVLVGFVNVALKAPAWMQLTHLALACIMWLVTVRLSYETLTAPRRLASTTPAGVTA
ncbi:cytochrome oxidase assembly [Deinococcus aerius]|uniref:Cytochrome oxidase assembly n=1 Tax=Deinococcus aerius TaxID=200253 RepID=A0A2I9CV47_9DEIO|nr:cytochrome oxidase assembly [Deinococcus aerius]